MTAPVKYKYMFVKLQLSLLALLFTISAYSHDADVLNGGAENGLVGSIASSFDVSPQGQYIYNIPLSVVSGTGGLNPKLSIVYNSGNGNGLLGYGFDLNGISMISRSPRNLYNDNIADIIRFKEQDRFSLDGLRLQYVGKNGVCMEYRTEVNTYSKILAAGPVANPSAFTAYTKDGLIYEYEASTSSDNCLLWLLRKVSDTKGNYYTISYNASGYEYVPAEIKYTGNANASQMPFASIVFSYQSISRAPSFIGGVKVCRSKAISRISVCYGNQEVKRYDLSYIQKKGKLFLTGVAETAGSEKYNSTKFTWDNSDACSLKKNSFTDFPDFHNVYVKTGDFNGDGKKDILAWANNKNEYKFRVYLNNGKEFDTPVCYTHDLTKVVGGNNKTLYGVAVGDFNGDGYDDIAIARQNAGACYYLDYCETNVSSSGNVSFVFKRTIKAPLSMQHKMMVTDINCDGAADILMVNANYMGSTYYTLMSKSTDNSVEPLVLSKSGEVSNDGFVNTSFVDLDGDGTMELLNVWDTKGSNGAGSCLYKLSKEGELTRITYLTLGGEDYFITGDFNGDGKTDIITTGNKDKTEWKMNYARGVLDASNLFHSEKFTSSFFSQKDKRVYGEDVNGDGLSDLVVIDKNDGKALEIWINKGTDKDFERHACQTVPGTNSRSYLLDDFNGDGKMDMLSYYKRGNSSNGFELFSQTNSSMDLLVGVTDGMGNQTEINYRHLTDACVFKHGGFHSYPLVSVGNSWPVVYSVITPNSTYSLHPVFYSYENPVYHKRGRGMLGFEKFRSYDYITHTTEETTFEIEKETASPVVTYRNTYLNGELVSETRYENALSFQHNRESRAEWVYSIVPCVTEVSKYEYNSKTKVAHIIVTDERNKYGDVVKQILDYGDRIVKTTCEYWNDESKWFIGRLTGSQVEKSEGSEVVSVSSAFKYDSQTGLLVSESYAPGKSFGYVKNYTYDVFGNIIKDVQIPNDGGTPREKTSTYTSDGRFIEKNTNELGFATVINVDAVLGKKTSETDCKGMETTYEYNSFGEPVCTSNGIEKVTTLRAWSMGNTYAPENAAYYVKTQVSEHTPVWSFYDSLGQLLREVRIGAKQTDIIFTDRKYDKRGLVIAVSEPYFKDASSVQWNTFTYDDTGRIVEQQNALGASVVYAYDGLTAKVTNARGYTSSKTLDMLGQLVKSTDALGNSITYKYDVNGCCKEVRGPRTTTVNVYDEACRRTKLIDPDLGTYMYTYDSYGNIVSETSGMGTSTFAYDAGGRLVREERPDLTYTYEYDTKHKGLLSKKACSNGNTVEYSYDVYGRETEAIETIHGSVFAMSRSYKGNRLVSLRYPSGLTLGYGYADNGTVNSVYNIADKKVFWKADKENANGQVELETLGNGIMISTAYDAAGKILEIATDKVCRQQYAYDLCNNLVFKSKGLNNRYYHYEYDELDRLSEISVSNLGLKKELQTKISYDEAGNVVYKTGIGVLSYQDGTNRLVSVSRGDYELPVWYGIEYSTFNKILSVKQHRSEGSFVGYNNLTLEYNPDKSRVYQEVCEYRKRKFNGGNKPYNKRIVHQRYYVSDLYEKEVSSEETKSTNYILVNGRLVALVICKGGTSNTYYLHKDNQGTSFAYTDDNANVVEYDDYDPWGRKQNFYTGEYSSDDDEHITDRGLTDHQYIDMFDMINMDGRMYDPYIGRFLTPDPFVQSPSDTQGLNRYAYCLNNPLSLTDPSGYNWIGDTFSAIVGIAVGFETAGIGSGLWGAVLSGACAGASSALANSMINGANLWQTTKSALVGGFWGAISSTANFGIGELTDNFYASSALHSISDGTMEALQGGHFEHGMLTGLVSYAGGQKIREYAGYMSCEAQVAANALLGGTVSLIGGGKFANGAMAGAFQMMYNDLMHKGPTYKQLMEIDEMYRASLDEYPNPGDFYESLGFPRYDNGCAARMSYALNKSGTLKIPNVAGMTKRGNDGNYYFMFAKDMHEWLASKNVWGTPRVFNYLNDNIVLKNGVVSQTGFVNATGHMEYFYNRHDGHNNSEGGAYKYYINGAKTYLWKYGK